MPSFCEIYQDILKVLCGEADSAEEDHAGAIERLASGPSDVLLRKVLAGAEKSQAYKLISAGDDDDDEAGFSRQQCLDAKDLGTRAFKQGRLLEAIGQYNDYLAMCYNVDKAEEAEKDELLRAGFANRSTILLKCCQFNSCLGDVAAALELSPEPGKEFVLLERRAKCLGALDRADEAAAAYEKALAALAEADVPEKFADAFRKQVESGARKLFSAEHENSENSAKATYTQNQNAQYAQTSYFSDAVRVAYDDRVGRHFVAGRDVRPGEVLADERPLLTFSQVDGETGVSRACHHCLGPFGAAVYPSPYVSRTVRFCSWKCVKEAVSTYHRHEAYVLSDYWRQVGRFGIGKEATETSGCMFLALRAVARKPSDFFNEDAAARFTRTNAKLDSTANDDGQVQSSELTEEEDEYCFLHNLVGHEKSTPARERVKLAVRSAILLGCLDRSGYFGAVSAKADSAEVSGPASLQATDYSDSKGSSNLTDSLKMSMDSSKKTDPADSADPARAADSVPEKSTGLPATHSADSVHSTNSKNSSRAADSADSMDSADSSKTTNPTQLTVLQLLYRLQLSIAHNVHSVYRVRGQISQDIPLEPVGTAVYRRTALINHSCAVNTSRFFSKDGRILFVSRRHIAKGQEITNNYGLHHLQTDLGQRQERLRSGFKFECGCEACVRDYPLIGDVPSKLGKSLSKQLERQLSAYQRAFAAGDYPAARLCSEQYLARLEAAGVAYPHKNYELGAIALNSCWWAILAGEGEQVLTPIPR